MLVNGAEGGTAGQWDGDLVQAAARPNSSPPAAARPRRSSARHTPVFGDHRARLTADTPCQPGAGTVPAIFG